MSISSCDQVSRAAEQERIACLRAELLRGGRHVRFRHPCQLRPMPPSLSPQRVSTASWPYQPA